MSSNVVTDYVTIGYRYTQHKTRWGNFKRFYERPPVPGPAGVVTVTVAVLMYASIAVARAAAAACASFGCAKMAFRASSSVSFTSISCLRGFFRLDRCQRSRSRRRTDSCRMGMLGKRHARADAFTNDDVLSGNDIAVHVHVSSELHPV